MKRAVVDASVALKWVVPEDHSEAADHLLLAGVERSAPAHWLGEVSTNLWAKSALRNLMTQADVQARIEWLCELDIAETPIRDLLPAATAIAFDLRVTVYDSLYLALAQRLGAPVVTADRKLLQSAAADPRFAALVVWVGDLLQ